MNAAALGPRGHGGPALRRRALLLGLGLGLAAGATVGRAEEAPGPGGLVLVMVRTPGCPWCSLWDREVRSAYLASATGRQLGLIEIDLGDLASHGLQLEAPVMVAPVFLLLRRAAPGREAELAGARELGRLVGYPGADFFWGYLDALVAEADASEGSG